MSCLALQLHAQSTAAVTGSGSLAVYCDPRTLGLMQLTGWLLVFHPVNLPGK